MRAWSFLKTASLNGLFFILQLFLWPRALFLFLNNLRTLSLFFLSNFDSLLFCFDEQHAFTQPTSCLRSENKHGVSSLFRLFRSYVRYANHLACVLSEVSQVEWSEIVGCEPSIQNVLRGRSKPADGCCPPDTELPFRHQVPVAIFHTRARESSVGSERSAPFVLVLRFPQATEKRSGWGNVWKLMRMHVTPTTLPYSLNSPWDKLTHVQCGSKLWWVQLATWKISSMATKWTSFHPAPCLHQEEFI